MGLRVMGVPLVACLVFSTFLLLAEVTSAAEETAKLSTTPIFPMISQGQTSKDFQVLLRLEAPLLADLEEPRLPIDLVVVLDVGGSMLLDPVTEAMKFVIEQLNRDDSLAIVGLSNSQLVKEIKTWRHNSNKKIEELKAHSDAYSGLEEAVKFLEELAGRSNSRRASFIILVTDRDDSSSRFSKKLQRDAILRTALAKHPVHTLGLGGAHDPKALQLIADESHGTYSFVDNLDDNKKITGALAVCLSGLKSVVAVGTRVGLEVAEGSGVKIESIESGGYKQSPITQDKTSGEVTIGALYGGEVKSFVLHLHVPAYTPVEGGCDQQRLLTASLFQHGSASTTIQAVLSVQRLPAADAAATMLHKVPVPIVVNHIVRFSLLEMVKSFVKKELVHLDSMTTVQERYGMGMKLQSQWEQFVQVRQFWSSLDLGGLESEITAMVSSLTTESGPSYSSRSAAVAYLFSWLSSYQMQRPTAMGSANNVAAVFVTLEMKLTLQMALSTDRGKYCPEPPVCEHCVQEPPPPLFVPSEGDVNSYRLNAAYQGIVSFDAINNAMNQIYLAFMEANKLKLCDRSGAGNLLGGES